MDNPTAEQPNSLEPEEGRERCANCGKKMAKKGNFCPHCGQKRFDGKMPFKELATKFIYKLTNLDNKILRMVWHLLIPAQVTKDYFAGKIKQYPHPFQFFFVVSFFLLLVFSKVADSSKSIHVTVSQEQTGFNANLNKEKKNKKNGKRKTATKKESDFYFLLERYVFTREVVLGYDSLPPTLQTPEVKKSLGIILEKTNSRWTHLMDTILTKEKSKDSLTLNFFTQKYKIAFKDIVELTPEEISDKYKIDYWLNRMVLKQSIRSLQDPADLTSAYIGSFSWTILGLIFVMAGWMKLFYWRQKRYYVEHFIFLMHWNSGVFLVFTILLGISHFYPLGVAWAFVYIVAAIFLLLSMKNFYGQNWFRTIFKWFWFLLFYLIGFIILFVIGLFVVFAIF
jgi:hypothetical protein